MDVYDQEDRMEENDEDERMDVNYQEEMDLNDVATDQETSEIGNSNI